MRKRNQKRQLFSNYSQTVLPKNICHKNRKEQLFSKHLAPRMITMNQKRATILKLFFPKNYQPVDKILPLKQNIRQGHFMEMFI